ncbi:hypothetical protein AMECASPLE_023632, partial [Ameca splendens]
MIINRRRQISCAKKRCRPPYLNKEIACASGWVLLPLAEQEEKQTDPLLWRLKHVEVVDSFCPVCLSGLVQFVNLNQNIGLHAIAQEGRPGCAPSPIGAYGVLVSSASAPQEHSLLTVFLDIICNSCSLEIGQPILTIKKTNMS